MQEMSNSLHGSAAETFWTGTTSLLTSAVFQPVIAAASTCYGRQRLLVISIVLCTFGTTFAQLRTTSPSCSSGAACKASEAGVASA